MYVNSLKLPRRGDGCDDVPVEDHEAGSASDALLIGVGAERRRLPHPRPGCRSTGRRAVAVTLSVAPVDMMGTGAPG